VTQRQSERNQAVVASEDGFIDPPPRRHHRSWQAVERTLGIPRQVQPLRQLDLRHQQEDRTVVRRGYRSYVSQTLLKHGAGSCPVGRMPAGEIETTDIDQLRAVFRQSESGAGTWKAARTHADDIIEADARMALRQLDPLWDELFPAEQAHIMALLVEHIKIGTDDLVVRLRIEGHSGIAREMLAGGTGEAT
jgi:hypothetical protein